MAAMFNSMQDNFVRSASLLVDTARSLYSRGWLLGTSGNLSAVISREPLLLAMSPSGVDKGALSVEQILMIDDRGRVVSDHRARPSDESPLHIRVIIEQNAGAVIHTHSTWSTLLSDLYADDRELMIEGYEMLKGLEGVKTHEHRERLPILENSQDMIALASAVGDILKGRDELHGFLLRGHGLYVWGTDLAKAKRHVEILEFLFEVLGYKLLVSKA